MTGNHLKQLLKQYNTFNVDSYTSNLTIINQLSDLQPLFESKAFDTDEYLLIGAGSNLLLLDDCPANVIAMRMQGVTYLPESNDDVIATVAAGVNWHQFVKDSLSKGFYGLENLALIPGLVGAAPIQNIGAYGVELCELFHSLTAVNLQTGEQQIFYKDECEFGYRYSIFKTEEAKQFMVTSVSLRLSTKPSVNIQYKALADAFINKGDITPEMVFDTVCNIRKSKLPDPAVLGNAGSFFKNPVISDQHYQQLKSDFPDLVAYPQADNNWKVAAGWMIEKAGLKGYRTGAVGVHTEQALVLVNHGDASGTDIARLAQYVRQTVAEQFSIWLEPEVTIIGSTGIVDLAEVQ